MCCWTRRIWGEGISYACFYRQQCLTTGNPKIAILSRSVLATSTPIKVMINEMILTLTLNTNHVRVVTCIQWLAVAQ